jgi:hypothetical protein
VAYLEIDRETLDQIPGVVDQQLAAARTANPKQPLPSVSHLKVSAQDEGLSVTCDFKLTVPDPAVQLRGNLDGQMTIAGAGPHTKVHRPAARAAAGGVRRAAAY